MSNNPYALSDDATGQGPTHARHEVLGLLALAAAVSYVARLSIGVAESTIREDMGYSLKQSGWLMGSLFLSYAILQIPAGRWSQEIGTRRALTLFAIAWSAAALSIGIAPGYWWLVMAFLLMGAAQAGVFPAATSSISHWIPQSRRSFACGILSVGMQVGAILAAVATGPLILVIGWRETFMIYAIPGFLWAMVFLSRFRDDPAADATVNEEELAVIQAGKPRSTGPSAIKPATPWRDILHNRSIWFLCGQQMCRAAGYGFFTSWFPTFLQKTREVTVSHSGYQQALVLVGTLTGSLFGGLLADWILQRTGSLRQSRSGVGATCLCACAALIFSAWFVKSAFLAVVLLAFGAFFAALAGPSAYVATIDIAGDHVPPVFGLMNMMGNLATAACPVLVAMLFEWTENWNLVLLIFATIFLIGAVCWMMVDPGQAITSVTVEKDSISEPELPD